MTTVKKMTGLKLLEAGIGIRIEILSNNYQELPGIGEQVNTYQTISFQVQIEAPDDLAVGILFCLSSMSFTYSAPRGYSENHFVPDEEWNLGYFVDGLKFKEGTLIFSSDYVSGRHMKTDIIFEPGGKVTLATRNRGRGAERWLLELQGRKHIEAVK